jgi:hypothetical protein
MAAKPVRDSEGSSFQVRCAILIKENGFAVLPSDTYGKAQLLTAAFLMSGRVPCICLQNQGSRACGPDIIFAAINNSTGKGLDVHITKKKIIAVVVCLLVCSGVYLAVEKGCKKSRKPDIYFLPTPQDVVERMLELARVTKEDLVYDLGCGDGRIVVTAAKKYGCKAVGYDIDPKRVKESLENVRKNKVRHLVRIEEKDIFTLDLSKADVITLYLLPRLNVRLIPQLEKLKPGSRIVSHDFGMKGVKPDNVVRLTSEKDSKEHTIYLWTTPLKKEEEALEKVHAKTEADAGGAGNDRQ